MEHSNPILMGNDSPQKFITIGEVMLRLTPPNYEKIRMASSFEASYGGSEANIALALAHLRGGSRRGFHLLQRRAQQLSGQKRCALAALQRRTLHADDPLHQRGDPQPPFGHLLSGDRLRHSPVQGHL